MNRTVQRTIDILDLISQHDQGVTLADVIRLTGMPKTSAYDILRTLEHKFMIYRRDDQANSYSIGFRAFAIGHTYSRSSHLLTNSSQEIRELAEKLEKTVFLCKDYDGKVLYVDKYEPKNALIMTPAIGEMSELGDSAAGQVFAVFSQDGDSPKIDAKLRERVMRQGFAAHCRTSGPPVYTVAAPIFNFENRLSGIVSIMALNHPDARPEEEGAEVTACAAKISFKMGYKNELPVHEKKPAGAARK